MPGWGRRRGVPVVRRRLQTRDLDDRLAQQVKRSPRDRAVGVGIAVSALLHVLVIWLADTWWSETQQGEAFRSRLALKPRFEPKRLNTTRPQTLPAPRMAYVPSKPVPPEAADVESQLPPPISLDAPASLAAALDAPQPGMRADTVAIAGQRMTASGEYGPGGLAEAESAMDLLRIQDLAEADGYRAAVILGAQGRRDTRGFVNFTRLNLYGVGAGRVGELDGLARHLRDYTGILAQVRGAQHRDFVSAQLLKDPVHFLIQDGGMPVYQDAILVNFSHTEKVLLGRYLRNGGFLFIESNPESPDGYRFLTQTLAVLHEVLGRDGRLVPIPTTHPVYHSYYDFDSGFPGEENKDAAVQIAALSGDSWDYPGTNRPGRLEQAATVDVRVMLRRGPQPIAQSQPTLPPVGLYGAELDGRLVALVSDLGLHANWVSGLNEDGVERTTGPSLMAGVNIVAYTLQRPGGPVVRRSPPTWLRSRPEQQVPGVDDAELATADWLDPEVLTTLDASLAVVLSPLGSSISSGLRLQVDGNAIDSTMEASNGLLLHNLSAGSHSLELWYEGKRRDLDVILEGGKVSTVTFALNRVIMFSRLSMKQQQEQVGLEQWLSSFADLNIEERFLGEGWVP